MQIGIKGQQKIRKRYGLETYVATILSRICKFVMTLFYSNKIYKIDQELCAQEFHTLFLMNIKRSETRHKPVSIRYSH